MLSIHSWYKKLVGKGGRPPYVLFHVDETDSTNRRIRETTLANMQGQQQEKPAMVVLATEYQTAGRGQGTNSWESENGKNLLFSILTYPTMVPVQSQFLLSMAGALALKEALETYGVEGVSLKWPNDIYWNDKKISGTLIETSLSGGHIKDCVFGIGLNVNQKVFSETLPNPVSLCQIVGRGVDREQLLEAIMASFVKHFKLIEEELTPIFQRFITRHFIENKVSIHTATRKVYSKQPSSKWKTMGSWFCAIGKDISANTPSRI